MKTKKVQVNAGVMDYAQAFFWITVLIKLADVLTVAVIWMLAWYLRFESGLLPQPEGVYEFSLYTRTLLPLCIAFTLAFHLIGGYRRDRLLFGFRALKKIAQGSIVGSLVFVATLYFMGEMHVSRIYIGVFTGLAMGGLAASRLICHGIWKGILLPQVSQFRVLLVGSGELLKMYVKKIRARNPYPIHWIGRVGPSGEGIDNIPYLGDVDSLKQVIEQRTPNNAVVSFPTECSSQYAPILELLSNELVNVKVLPDFGKYSTFTYHAEHEVGMPLLVFNHPPLGMTDRVFKRAVDIIGALFFLIVAAPIYFVLSIGTKLSSKGPIFFRQERIGADGRRFMMYKFRTMYTEFESSPLPFTVKGDDRVTPFGRWIRKFSLDEIPQFYNVLKGDMSLVGPRPERTFFVEQFRKEIPKYMLRHKTKSGITGWAQINGWRGNTSIEERIKYDLYYIEHWSHYLDIKILFLTLFRGFSHPNAY